MSNPSKQKGTAGETAVVRWLQAHGWPSAERQPLYGAKDRGDIAGVAAWTLSVKNCAKLALAEWLGEAHIQAQNNRTDLYAVIHKKRGTTDVGDWYVTLPMSVFMEAIK